MSQIPVRSEPLVTIAIPTHNRAAFYLPLALQSALDQTYGRLEILVSDNASTDGTPELMQSVRDPRVRYLRHHANIGANANYNFCLHQARGDYFVLLHDDDLVDADFVERCAEAALDTSGVALVRTGIRIIDDRGRILRAIANDAAGLEFADFVLAWFAGKTCWYLANSFFATEPLRESGGFRSRHGLAEDGFAIARLGARCPRADISEVKSSFRVHGGELTFAAKATDWAREYLDLLDCLCSLMPSDRRSEVRRAGARFFARLSYNRAAAIRSRAERLKAYWEIFELFERRYPPYHRIRSLSLAERAWRAVSRRARDVLKHA